ncbi:hypothetical protein SCHPADRAFT_498948 [Schizopora paradoxa]|uniref:Uncharacterized protein n=1 Tax=Schizopora paradoxa TaxID=27342 RepID=A0A0H2S1F9_9AGAM|nr:hypothetical protein SCHPADRAFT_498948 [Schizopora paradoxa]
MVGRVRRGLLKAGCTRGAAQTSCARTHLSFEVYGGIWKMESTRFECIRALRSLRVASTGDSNPCRKIAMAKNLDRILELVTQLPIGASLARRWGLLEDGPRDKLLQARIYVLESCVPVGLTPSRRGTLEVDQRVGRSCPRTSASRTSDSTRRIVCFRMWPSFVQDLD